MSLNVGDVRKFLSGTADPGETLTWLQTAFMPAAKAQLDSVDVRRRIALYAGERIPENERNLTDVRNRVSLIIEYELARIATRLVEEAGINDLFWSYVVANRFPDLEVRNSEGRRGLRVEVKCLQSVAEEKSANFDTLRKDVHPKTDFLVVFLWEWKHDPSTVHWDRAPYIEKVFVFHASSLAMLRDWYWLNSPPSRLGGGLQGFDLRYAVNCNDGRYNQEEGNYGKLLRLWQDGFEHQPTMNALEKRTMDDYLVFQRAVVETGFDNLSARLLPALTDGAERVAVIHAGRAVGWRAGDFVFVLDARFRNAAEILDFLAHAPAPRVISFTSKYGWKECALAQILRAGRQVPRLQVVHMGRKPKHLIPTLTASETLPPAQVIAAGQDES